MESRQRVLQLTKYFSYYHRVLVFVPFVCPLLACTLSVGWFENEWCQQTDRNVAVRFGLKTFLCLVNVVQDTPHSHPSQFSLMVAMYLVAECASLAKQSARTTRVCNRGYQHQQQRLYRLRLTISPLLWHTYHVHFLFAATLPWLKLPVALAALCHQHG
jgi:hypothetical protein